MVEPLEDRLHFSRYSLLPVLNYDNSGTSYKYATTALIGPNSLIASGQKSTTSKTTITRKTATPPTYVAKTTTQDNDGDESMTLVQGSAGVALTAETVAYTGADLSLTFSNVQFAPASLGLNKKYTGSGSVTGLLAVDGSALNFDGTFAGTASTSVTLYGTTSITVRGVTYDNALEGAFGIDASGTLTATSNGQTESGPLSIVQTKTFWSVPGVGIVYDRRAVTIAGSAQGSERVSVPLTAKDSLISYVLGANA